MDGLLGGPKAMISPSKLLGDSPPVPPPPSYYVYAFRLMDFSYTRYGIKGRFRGDVVWNRGRAFERRTSETAYHISSVAAFVLDELKIKAKDSQIVGYKENISLPKVLGYTSKSTLTPDVTEYMPLKAQSLPIYENWLLIPHR